VPPRKDEGTLVRLIDSRYLVASDVEVDPPTIPGRENSSAWRILGRSLFIGGMAPLYPQPKESISMGRLTEAFDYTNLAVQAVCVRQGVYLARSQRSSLRVGLNDNRWENKCVTNLSQICHT